MNEFFDKVYVLSLKRSIDRRNLVSERLSRSGIEFEFFDACDGSVLNHIWSSLNNHNFKNSNYLACSISHLSIYNDAISKGYEKILILEDDVRAHINIDNLFSNIKGQIPNDWNLLYFGWIPLSDDCTIWDYRVINDRFISDNIFRSKNLWGLYSYSISKKLMLDIIQTYNNSFPMELDRYFVYNIQENMESYGVSPQLFCHDMLKSNNEGYVDQYSLYKSIDNRISKIEDYI